MLHSQNTQSGMIHHVRSHVPNISHSPNRQNPATPPAIWQLGTFSLVRLPSSRQPINQRPPPPTPQIPPKWVAFEPRPSRSPPRSSLSGTTPDSPWTSRYGHFSAHKLTLDQLTFALRPTSVSAMRLPSLLPSACVTRCVELERDLPMGREDNGFPGPNHRPISNMCETDCRICHPSDEAYSAWSCSWYLLQASGGGA